MYKQPILSHARQDDLTYFCEWLPTCQLKTLTLPPLEPHNIEMVSSALVKVSTLKTLEMKGSKFTLRSMEAFASIFFNQSLTSVDISENCDINECSLDSDCARCLARALYNNTTLTMLDLCIDLGERGALEIAEKLKYNSTLRLLNMTEDSVSISESGALAMDKTKDNTTLALLNMTEDSIGERGAQATLALLNMTEDSIGERGAQATLALLNMTEDSIGERGAQATLALLNMTEDSIGERGAQATLALLNMTEDSIGERGAQATLALLNMTEDSIGERGAQTTLTQLNMTEDSIGERGAQAMEYNATRTVLNMGEMGAQEMAEMLLHNKTLKSLRMYSCTIGVEGAMALVNSLAENHHLRELHISDKYTKEVEALPAYQNNKERVYMSEV